MLPGNFRLGQQSREKPPNSKPLHAIIVNRTDDVACSDMFEVRARLCLFGFVIGAFHEGETGMRCGAIAPTPQLPPQL
jgi:hypothetical protein